MANPSLSLEMAQDAVDRVNEMLRQGHRPIGMAGPGTSAVEAAAVKMIAEGVINGRSGMNSRLLVAKARFGIEPDWSLYVPPRFTQPVPQSVILPAPQGKMPEPTGGQWVLAIGDLHQDPRQPHRLDVLTWIARYASEVRPDRIIQIGDWSTFDSVNMHEKPGSLGAQLKPSIRADLDNQQASLAAWRRGLAPDFRPRQYVCLGNHENRLERFENMNPESQGMFTLARDQAFLQNGWHTRKYGQGLYVENAEFVHHPTNGSGRAFGGETGPQRAANKTTVATISGHTHRRQVFDAAKNGPMGCVSMVEIGCAMPWGEIEHYVGAAPSGWWWGVCLLHVREGYLPDLNFVSMLTLRDKFSGDGADIRAA